MLDICPNCRRLAHIGTATNGEPGDRRCIDCWFSPDPEHWVAVARCVLNNGLTGDIVKQEFSGDHFWPHDDSPEAWKNKPEPVTENQIAYRYPL